MTDTPMKRCSRGDQCVHPMGCWQPATSDYFGKRTKSKDGFYPTCKACISKRGREVYKASGETIRARVKAYRERNPELIRERKQRYYFDNRDSILTKMQARHAANPMPRRESARQYRRTNREKVQVSRHRYYEANKDSIRDYHRKYRAENKEKLRLYAHNWQEAHHQRHRENQRAAKQRRRARKLSLPDQYSRADWQHALDYFNGCCAVCGRQLNDLFGTHTASADHWIPLSDPHPDNPGSVKTNIVPLCHGEDGCNNRKSDRDPIEFLETEFGKRRAKQILNRILAYFASLTE